MSSSMASLNRSIPAVRICSRGPSLDHSPCLLNLLPAEQDASGSWALAITKAKALVAQLTTEEKASHRVSPLSSRYTGRIGPRGRPSNPPKQQVNLTAGVSSSTGCSGFLPGIPRLGFPGLCLADAGNGIKSTDFVNAWPAGIHKAASWNKELTYQTGYGLGGEARVKGVHLLLGPVVGPIGRVVEGGRNWEGEWDSLLLPLFHRIPLRIRVVCVCVGVC